MRSILMRGMLFGILVIGTVRFTPSAWAAAFYNLGTLPDATNFPSSAARGVSPDGLLAVGNTSVEVPGGQAAQWTVANGLSVLPRDPAYFSGEAKDASLGGAYIIGQRQLLGNLHYRGFRFHNGAYTDMGDLPGGTVDTIAMAISYDGGTVIGLGNYNRGLGGDQGFIWKESTGIRGIGFLPGYVTSQAIGISGDGNVVVGNSSNSSGHGPAVRWTQAGGMIGLGDLPNGTNDSTAAGASFDGSVIAGSCLINGTTLEAFRWTQAAGMVGLGDLPGGQFYSVATAISDDGTLIGGYSTTGTTVGVGYEAFLWDAIHGMRNFKQVLVTDYGLNLTGWTLDRINGISADGTTFVGDGYDPQNNFRGWVAVIPEPAEVAIVSCMLLGAAAAHRSPRNSPRRGAKRN